MPSIEINGGYVEYEFIGDEAADVVVITPGGRFSKDVPGVRPLANALAEGGMRVLLWDRPNCGKSDVQFYGKTESFMRAETLGRMLEALDVGPVVIAGGSGGARDSMLTVMLYPELAKKLIIWWPVGGVFGTISLTHNVIPNIRALRSTGLEGMMQLEPWKTLIATNPRNKNRIEAIGAEEMEKIMFRWFQAFVPRPGQTIPGVEDEMLESIKCPTLIIRSGRKDIDHPMRISLELSAVIENSTLIEPPWAEDVWNQSLKAMARGEGFCFDAWPEGAPVMLEYIRSS